MGYRIAVCVKPVPEPEQYDRITINPLTKTIVREGIPMVINPADKHAIEAALQVKEKYGGQVTVFSMAPLSAEGNLREALAMGADEAVLLSDRAFAGADTLATSYTLAAGLGKYGVFDLVFTGTESADGATSQVPAQLAEELGMAHLWNVKEFAFESERVIRAKAKIENGYLEYIAALPVLLAVSRELNKPRYTTIAGVMKARKKPFYILSSGDLELEHDRIGLQGSPTQPGDIYSPSLERKGKILKGPAEEIVPELLGALRRAGVWQETWKEGSGKHD